MSDHISQLHSYCVNVISWIFVLEGEESTLQKKKGDLLQSMFSEHSVDNNEGDINMVFRQVHFQLHVCKVCL